MRGGWKGVWYVFGHGCSWGFDVQLGHLSHGELAMEKFVDVLS